VKEQEKIPKEDDETVDKKNASIMTDPGE